MHVRSGFDARQVWRAIAQVCSGIGGVLYVVKGVRLVLAVLTSPRMLFPEPMPLLLLAALVVLLGVIGIVAATWSRIDAGAAVVGQAVAGGTGLLLEAVGRLPLPHVVPGMLLLVGAVSMYTGREHDRVHSEPVIRPFVAHILLMCGLLAYGVVAIPLLARGLATPLWAMVGMFGIWGGLLAGALRLQQKFPWVMLVIPALAYVVVDCLLTWGAVLFNWRA